MPKNIVICCDGTNNDPEHPSTNVARLYEVLDKESPEQIVYYDPGVGTFAQPGLVSPAAKGLSMAFGLAFGVGFKHNLEQAYTFLIRNYKPGDRLFFFGFSRGAFTVHALAGLVHMCGILRSAHENLVPYASRIYQGPNFEAAARLQDTYSHKLNPDDQPIHFLGVWDTVSSVGFFLKRHTKPYTTFNPRIRKIRHAMAINERRAYFQPERWKEARNQELKEVWFPGVHSDVGGGYPAKEAELAKISLVWMIQEAVPDFAPDLDYPAVQPEGELRIDGQKYEKVLLAGRDQANGQYIFDPVGSRRHRSLKGPWWALEGLPKNDAIRRLKIKFPLARRRQLREEDLVHASAVNRREGASYRPRFDPTEFEQVSWPKWAAPKTVSDPVPEDVVPPSGTLRTAAIVIAVSYVFWSLVLGLSNVWLTIGRTIFESETGWTQGAFWKALAGSSSESFWNAWEWPCNVYYAVRAGHYSWHEPWLDSAESLLLLVAPIVVIVLGGWIMNSKTGFGPFEDRVRETILHKRLLGYDASNLASQFFQLRAFQEDKEQPLDLYRKSLEWDRWFPVFYVPVFAACLWLAGSGLPLWFLLALPILAGVADFVENRNLIRLIDVYQDFKRDNPRGVRIGQVLELFDEHQGMISTASRATTVKIGLIIAALTLLAGNATAPIQLLAVSILSILVLFLLYLGSSVFFRAWWESRRRTGGGS